MNRSYSEIEEVKVDRRLTEVSKSAEKDFKFELDGRLDIGIQVGNSESFLIAKTTLNDTFTQ
jgi:hypothetical protein